MRFASGVSLALYLSLSVSHATAPTVRPVVRPTASDSFVKDRALARLLGETLFRDTVNVMSDPANQPTAPQPLTGQQPSTGQPATASGAAGTDKSAVAQVARTVLAQQTLDKYLWLIQQAYDDSMWKGGDRARIEQHFPLIWRTSILLYEAGLTVTPHRVRVCTPGTTSDEFDCRDEIELTRIVPIPSQAPLIQAHRQEIG
jgi:hypothetical protein